MANIGGNPYKIIDVAFKIAADNFEAMVASAEIVPSPSLSTFTGIGGRKVPIVGKSSWGLALTFAQDFVTTGSLSLKLFNGEGTVVAVTVTPKAGGPSFTGSVLLVAPNIGGAAEADAMTTVTLPWIDKPVLAV